MVPFWKFRPAPLDMLLHVALGYYPGFTDEACTRPGWARLSHRGLLYLDKFTIPKKEKSAIFNKKWQTRWNGDFENVVRACGDESRSSIQNNTRRSWITEDLVKGLVNLNRLGFAHSFESWLEGKLAGGCFGFQIGGYYASCSAFFRAPDAGKAAWAQMHTRLAERGFKFIDWGGVASYGQRYGVGWVSQGQFESEMWTEMRRPLQVDDAIPSPRLPALVSAALPIARAARSARRLLAKWKKPPPPPKPPESQTKHESPATTTSGGS